MILVIGGSGPVGRELIGQLVGRGATVRALTRSPERARPALPDGVEVVQGDLLQPDTLDPALLGVEKVFLLSGGLDPRQLEMQSNAVTAARRHRVGHLVKLSTAGARHGSPVPTQSWHAEIEDRLEQSGLPFTILRPTYFMQNLAIGFAQTIRSEGIFYAPAGNGRIAMIDVADIAEVAATILIGGGYRGERLYLSGPEAISFEAVATQLTALLRRPIRYVPVRPQQAREAMLRNEMPGWVVEAMLALYEQLAASLEAELTGQVARVLGRPPRSFTEFARRSLHLFERQARA